MAEDALVMDADLVCPRLVVDNVITHSGFEKLYHGLSPGRIGSLSDGVFAIVMTLLVFQLKLPDIQVLTSQPVMQTLQQLAPSLVCYAISFMALGKLWISHNAILHHIHRVDRSLLWLNIVFMFFVSLIPFSASFIAQCPNFPETALLYGLNLMAAGLMLFSIWRYSVQNHHLVSYDIEPHVIPMANIQILKGTVVYAVGVLFSFVNPYVSIGIYMLVPVLYVMPAKLDQHWRIVNNTGSTR